MVISMWSRSASQGVSFLPQPLTAPGQGVSYIKLLTDIINTMHTEGILTKVRSALLVVTCKCFLVMCIKLVSRKHVFLMQ